MTKKRVKAQKVTKFSELENKVAAPERVRHFRTEQIVGIRENADFHTHFNASLSFCGTHPRPSTAKIPYSFFSTSKVKQSGAYLFRRREDPEYRNKSRNCGYHYTRRYPRWKDFSLSESFSMCRLSRTVKLRLQSVR